MNLSNPYCPTNFSNEALPPVSNDQELLYRHEQQVKYILPSELLSYATFFSLLFTTLAIIYVETTYRGLRYFYRQGKMKRYYPLTSNRELLRNFLGAGSFISPTVFTYFYLCYDPARPISFSFHPFEILFFSAVYMICHDQWFYHMHVHSHTDRWLYEKLHKLHHEYTHEMNVFMTAYGTLTENLIDVGLGWCFNVLLANYISTSLPVFGYSLNFWNLLAPFTFATLTTILGHSGYASSPYFALFHPLIICVRPIARYMLTPNDHQAHHLLRRYNYGLFFRFNDKFYGTYRRSTAKAYDIHHWAAELKKGESMRGKMTPDHKGRVPLPYEELEPGWGF